MIKKTMMVIVSGMLMLNLTGCFLFVAGVAGGAGTAVWLSGKLTQEFHDSFHATVDATKMALQTLNFPVAKETYDVNIAQIKSVYSDGREIWIDIHRVTDESTRVDVRVGAVTPDKEAASLVLKKIQNFLPK